MPSPKKYGSQWSKGMNAFVDLEMPSGELCQVREPNPRQLVSLGILDSYDKLSDLVQTKHIDRVKGKPSVPSDVDIAALANDPRKIMQMLEIADRVVEHMVVQPEVRRPIRVDGVNDKGEPIEIKLRKDERDEDQIYTDMIDDIDKMFIFQYAVGVDPDLATFRKQWNESPQSLGDGVKVPVPPKRPARRR